jgi:hypothetical protein
MFKKITDISKIRSILDDGIYTKKLLSSVYIKSKNTIYEGVEALGAVTYCATGKKRYSFTNSDSQYKRLLVSCDLEDIGYIEDDLR